MPLSEQELRDNKRRQNAAYYARNKERCNRYASKWQKDHPKETAISHSRWNRAHPETMRKNSEAYYKRNPERLRERSKRFYHTRTKIDPALRLRRKEAKKRWRLANPNYANEHYARYKFTQNGKAKIRAASLKRRALKKAATVNLLAITDWIKRIRSKASAVCYYCSKRISTSDIHIDHIVPLATGGAHSVENLCVSCNHCNSSKGAKPIRAWIRMGQQILEL